MRTRNSLWARIVRGTDFPYSRSYKKFTFGAAVFDHLYLYQHPRTFYGTCDIAGLSELGHVSTYIGPGQREPVIGHF